MSHFALLLCLLQATTGQPGGTTDVPSTWKPSDFVVIGSEAQHEWRGEPISLSLRNAEVAEVLRSFAKISGLNLVLDPAVEGKVTVELKDVPWDQALSVILKVHRLGLEVDGQIWTVSPTAAPVPQRRPDLLRNPDPLPRAVPRRRSTSGTPRR